MATKPQVPPAWAQNEPLGVMDPVASGAVSDLPSLVAYAKQQHIPRGSPRYRLMLLALHNQRVKSDTPQAVAGASAFVHNAAKPFVGAMQDIANLTPGGAAFNQQVAGSERAYQATTPNGIGTDIGAVAGTIAPYLIGGRALKAAGLIPKALTLGGKLLAGAGAGAAMSALTPVTDPGSFAAQKGLQTLGGAVMFPATDLGLRGLAKLSGGALNAGRLATSAGRQKLADSRLARLLLASSPTREGRIDIQPTLARLRGAETPLEGTSMDAGQALGGPRGIQLSRTFRTNPDTQIPLVGQGNANDAARMRVVRKLAGLDPETGKPTDALDAAKQARTDATQPFIDQHLVPATPLMRWTAAAEPFDLLLSSGRRMSGSDHEALTQARKIVAKVRGGTMQEDDGADALAQLEEGVASKSARAAFQSAFADLDHNMARAKPLIDHLKRLRHTQGRHAIKSVLDGLIGDIKDGENTRGMVQLNVLDDVRRDLKDRLVSVTGKRATPEEMERLDPAKHAIINTIESRAPGYPDYLATYAKASEPVDTMEGVRGLAEDIDRHRDNSAGNKAVTPSDLVRFLTRNGLKRYGIGPDALEQLERVRASAELDAMPNIKLGTKASDTMQLKRLPKLTGHIGPYTGRLMGLMAGPFLEAAGVPHGFLLGEGAGFGIGSVLEAPLQSANRDIVTRMGQTFANPKAAAAVLSRAHPPPGRLQKLAQTYLLPYESVPRVTGR